MNAYFVKAFDFKTDIPMEYPFKYRDIYYSEEDILNDIRYRLNDIHSEYEEITNSTIDYNKFYTKFELDIEVGIVSLNHRSMITKDDYNKYLEEVKTINKEDLLDYLLSFTDSCSLYYDHNLNLKNTYCKLENYGNETEMNLQFAFSYKALFPEKYHVNKYKDGDRIKYNGNEYIIYTHPQKDSIYDSQNPLDYLYGYSLFSEDGYIIQDDKWCYFVVDEDLEPLPSTIKHTTNDHIDDISSYIFSTRNKSNTIKNIPENMNKEYTKLIRSDNHLSIILETDKGSIDISNNIDRNLMSYTLFNGEDPIVYIIGYITIKNDCYINEILIRYDDNIIDNIIVNRQYSKGNIINIAKYIE